jgi:Ca2+-binding RTX toxin-like protein
VKITLKDGQWVNAFVGGIKEDKLLNIHSLYGGRAGDKLTGDGNANHIAGGRGKDTLDGAGGIDTVDYSDKSKRVDVTLNKSHDVTVRVGKSAEDTIRNFENIVGGKAGDILTGDSRANKFVGAAGRDTIDGGRGLDLADYSEKVSGVKVTLDGSNWATVSVGGKSEDRIRNIEKLLGGYGNDTLTGDGGANTLQGAVGKDRLDGKGGIDTVDYSDRPWAISADLSGSNWSTVRVNGVAEDTIRRIENVIGSFRDDSISGDGKANMLAGGSGNDTLYGSGGIDTLKGGSGNDELRVAAGIHPAGVIDGGSGRDILSVRDQGTSYTADLRALTLKSIEVFEFGSPGAGGTATIRMKASQFAMVSWGVQATIVGSGQNDHLVVYAGSQIDLSDLLFQNFTGRISVVGDKDGSHIYGSIRADSIVGGQQAGFPELLARLRYAGRRGEQHRLGQQRSSLIRWRNRWCYAEPQWKLQCDLLGEWRRFGRRSQYRVRHRQRGR